MSKTMWLLLIVVALAVGIYLMQNYESSWLQPFRTGLDQLFDKIQVYVNRPSQIFTDVSSLSHAITVGLTGAVVGGLARAVYGKALKKGEEVSQKALNLAEQKTTEALAQVTTITEEKDLWEEKFNLSQTLLQEKTGLLESTINEQKGKIAAMGEQISKLIEEKNQLQRLVAEKTVIVEKAVP